MLLATYQRVSYRQSLSGRAKRANRAESTDRRTHPVAVKRLTIEELLALPAVVDLTTAGRAWGVGETKAAELARAGEFPCAVRPLGRKRQVRKVDLFRSLGLNLDGTPAGSPAQDVA
jgi:hypothetical protein